MIVDTKAVHEISYAYICEAKGLCTTVGGFRKYKTALTSIYHAVCLDIDDTLTYNNKEDKKLIVSTLARLTKLNVIICFITGRGKNNAFEFIYDLKDSIKACDTSIRESQFRRWYCITKQWLYVV